MKIELRLRQPTRHRLMSEGLPAAVMLRGAAGCGMLARRGRPDQICEAAEGAASDLRCFTLRRQVFFVPALPRVPRRGRDTTARWERPRPTPIGESPPPPVGRPCRRSRDT
eukprot:362275-Chlamydomonas_euryale.AAC.4